MRKLNLFIRLMFILALTINVVTYATYSFSFAASFRPSDLPRGDAAILTAIYFGYSDYVAEDE